MLTFLTFFILFPLIVQLLKDKTFLKARIYVKGCFFLLNQINFNLKSYRQTDTCMKNVYLANVLPMSGSSGNNLASYVC